MPAPHAASRALAALLLPLLSGCSVRDLAIEGFADALAGSTAEAFARDDDPALVREAMPFALKTTEALLLEAPENEALLVSACSSFTSYAYAFVELEAEEVEPVDYRRALALRERAFGLYERARDYGLRAVELSHPGIGERLRVDPEAAAAELGVEDVEAAYWTAAAWGSAIGLALDRPDVVADLDAVRAVLRRLLALDEDWGDGTLHEAMIAIESLPEAMGGSPERAREHFARAVELSGGTRAGPYVALAVGVALPAQDAAEFVALLEEALAVDPDAAPEERLANAIVQRRARLLLERADDLILPPLDSP